MFAALTTLQASSKLTQDHDRAAVTWPAAQADWGSFTGSKGHCPSFCMLPGWADKTVGSLVPVPGPPDVAAQVRGSTRCQASGLLSMRCTGQHAMAADGTACTARAPGSQTRGQTSKMCGCTEDVHGRLLLKPRARVDVSRAELKHQQVASVCTTHILCRT